MLWPNGLKEQITAVFLDAFPYLKIVVHEIVGSPGDAGVRASIIGTHLSEVVRVLLVKGRWPLLVSPGERPRRP